MSSLEDNTFDIRIAICSLAIRHQIIERLVFKKFKDAVKCFSPGGGFHSPFYSILSGRPSSVYGQSICRHCLNEIAAPSIGVQGLQRDQIAVEEELITLSRQLVISSTSPGALCVVAGQEYQLELQEYKDLLSKKWEAELRRRQDTWTEGTGDISRYIWLPLVLSVLLALNYLKPVSIRRRPPPRGRRGSCYSTHNPRPQPSILSEKLSEFATPVRGSMGPLTA
jgi:hypothetical protein